MSQPALPVIVNTGGGTAIRAGDALERRIHKAFDATGRPIDLRLIRGAALADTLAAFAGHPRIAVGGGDGTLGTAAGVVAGTGTELAILPLGTRNHFAQKIGVPLDLAQAATLAVHGAAQPVDIGAAGGLTFLNTAVLGASVDLVRAREASGLGKGIGSVIAAWRVLFHLRPRRYDLELDGRPQELETIQLFIGNNRYRIGEGRPGKRGSMTAGSLSVLAFAPLRCPALLRIAWRMATSHPDMRHDFTIDAEVREIVVRGDGYIGLAIDGEQRAVALPLRLAIRPRQLLVVTPARQGGDCLAASTSSTAASVQRPAYHS